MNVVLEHFQFQSSEFVISRVVYPPSVNEAASKDSTHCYSRDIDSDGGKGPSQTVTQISSTCLLVY